MNSKHLGRLSIKRSTRKEQEAAEVVDMLRRLFKAIHEYSKAIHRQTGLSGPQLWALTILAAEPGLSLGDLSARMFAHPSTVSGIIDRLQERRAVRRLSHPRDARALSLKLTPEGRRLLRRSPPPVQVGLRGALIGMPQARLRELRRSLEGIARQTEAHHVRAPFFDLGA